jgi:predicted enzyme related to lactoylglutathione lyase
MTRSLALDVTDLPASDWASDWAAAHLLAVPDAGRVARFYVEAFGAVVRREALGISARPSTEVSVGEERLMLVEALPAVRWRLPGQVLGTLECADIEEAVLRVIEAGGVVEVVYPPRTALNSMALVVLDPAGYAWALRPECPCPDDDPRAAPGSRGSAMPRQSGGRHGRRRAGARSRIRSTALS